MSCIIKKVLTINIPLSTSDIKVYNNTLIINDKCYWSWSFDNTCWVQWSNFDTFKTSISNSEIDFYVRILTSEVVTGIAINGVLSECYSTYIYNENPFSIDMCNNNLFNPYSNVDCAIQLQQQISDSIICMFGIPAYYFKVKPDSKTIDFTFKEYVLHQVCDVKKIKLMLEDGTMPSSMPQMTEFDFDWDNDWNVEIGKTDFAKAFGDYEVPKQRDFLYVPLMKRMYEVNSAYDERQNSFMWQSTTFKLGLIKYAEKTNVDVEDYESIIDNLIVNKYSEIIGDKEDEERRRESGIDQTISPKYTPDNLYNLYLDDSIRLFVSEPELNNVISTSINNESITIAKNMYNFTNKDSIIEYNKRYCGNTGALSFIITTPNDINISKKILSIGDIDVVVDNMSIILGDTNVQLEPLTTYLFMYKWVKNNYSVEVNVMKLVANEKIPKYRLKPEHYKFIDYYKNTSIYNDSYICQENTKVILSPNPLLMTNIKLYEGILTNEELFKESMKYSTNNIKCVINDCARPLVGDYGFSVR